MLLYLKNKTEKFGNNTEEANNLATDLVNGFSALINKRPNGRGGVYRCGVFSVDWRFSFGFATGATPDGRKFGEAVSKNVCATTGMDKNGVTAFMQSVLKLNSLEIPDGCVTDIVLHNSAVKNEDGMEAFYGLLKAFMKGGGSSVHFNVLNPSVLREAQKSPEKYKNLQIRLCGWNVYFVDLSLTEQNEFILQAEHG